MLLVGKENKFKADGYRSGCKQFVSSWNALECFRQTCGGGNVSEDERWVMRRGGEVLTGR